MSKLKDLEITCKKNTIEHELIIDGYVSHNEYVNIYVGSDSEETHYPLNKEEALQIMQYLVTVFDISGNELGDI